MGHASDHPVSHWPDEPFSKRKGQILRLGSLMETVGRTSPSVHRRGGLLFGAGFSTLLKGNIHFSLLRVRLPGLPYLLTFNTKGFKMLVLARKEGEAVTITTPEGFTARIVLLECEHVARLGIEAPKDWAIFRSELLTQGEQNATAKMEG